MRLLKQREREESKVKAFISEKAGEARSPT
jgi:hypothetical protein